MVLVKRFALSFICVLVGPFLVAAQDLTSISKLENQIRKLEAERASLDNEIKRLNEKLVALKSHGGKQSGASTDEAANTQGDRGGPLLEALPGSTGNTNPVVDSGVVSGASAPPGPSFELSHPDSGRTDRPTGDFKLSWSRAPWATSFTVEVREDQNFGTPGHVIRRTGVARSPFTIPKDTLEPGKEYYWQVTAQCDPANPVCAGVTTGVVAANGPYSFSTIRQLGFFNYLSDKGFSLQRVVVGDEESEGASFSFLRSIGEKTVYAADFAFIWNSGVVDRGNNVYSLESSVEGHLTSDDSEAEDALRFATGALIITRLRRAGFNGLHSTLGAKLEADQRFTTKKLFFEASETLTARKYYMGQYSGRVSDPVQFRWRPFLAFQVGHTFKQGEGRLPERTVLRLIPRARFEMKLNFISQALKIPRTLLFADDTFYYLPIEADMRSTNFLTSGLEFDFTPNLGLSFNYKNGKSAPKFQHVHTFGAAFTIRFGKNQE